MVPRRATVGRRAGAARSAEVFVLAQGQHLIAVGGDQNGVLPLGRQLPVLGDRRPAVAQLSGLGAALVDHRLDGEGHAFLELHAGSCLAIMQYLGLFMEYLADAVAAVIAHHAVAVGVGMILDDLADIAQARARAYHRDTLVQAFLGDPGQALDPFRYFTDMEHLAGVTEVAVLDDGDVDVHRIAVLQRLVVGNAMTYHMVERGADGLGKGDAAVAAAVVQRCGNGFLHIDDIVVADAVELIGGDARLDVLLDHFQHFGGEAAGHAHAGDVFGGLDGYTHEAGFSRSTTPRRRGMD